MDDLYIRLIIEEVFEEEYTKAFDENLTDESGEKQIKFFLTALSECDISPEEYDDIKDATESKIFRLQGDRLFSSLELPYPEDKCVEVITEYNTSITNAPCQSEELALAYAARSAYFLKLEKYNLCMEDINRAMALTCPRDVRAQLYVRRVECLNALGDSEEKAAIEDTRLLLEYLDLTDTLRRKLIEKLDSMKMAEDVREPDDPEQLPLPRINNPNTEAPCASDAVAIAYNEEHGRHLVATRDINQGELLIVEKPYSMVLDINKVHTNCANCFETCWASIPCDYCTAVMYCSKDCRDKSWEEYHDMECVLSASMLMMSTHFVEINLCSLRLTILAVREFGSIEGLREEMNEVNNCKDLRTKGFSKDGVLTGDKYRNVLGLPLKTDKLSKEQLLVLSLHSCYMLYYVASRSTLFGNPVNHQTARFLATNNDAVFIGTLLFRHIQLLRIHGQFMYEESDSGEWTKCGFGILPLSSIMNRSYNPNTVIQRMSENRPLCCVSRCIARNDIKEGEQLFDCCSPCDVDSLKIVC